MLHIQLLGEFRLANDTASVTTINTQRLQSLVAYLLLHRSSPVPRQRLAFLLWPDSSEAQARTNLRNLLHALNKALPDAEHFLAVDGQTLQWCPGTGYTLDVESFEQALQNGDSAEGLRTAVNLYHGELLPGCYDDWILPERERLEREFTEALERLVDELQAGHEYREAISYAQRLLQHDPLREETYRRLMRLYALSGDRAGVKRAYENCVAALKRELDVEPSRETIQEYEQAIKREMPNSTVAESAPPLPEATRSEPPTRPAANDGGDGGMVWVSPRGFPKTEWPILPFSGYRLRQPIRYAKDIVTWFVPVLTLAVLVFVLNVPLLFGSILSLIILAGLYFVFNPRNQDEESTQEIKDEVQEELDECEARVMQIRALTARIGKPEVHTRVLRTCDVADRILQELKRDEDCSLVTASRLEFVLSETRQILDLYAQIILGRVTAHPDNLNAIVAKIEGDLLEQLESSLKDFAVKLDQVDIVNLEATIRVLESTLKLEGLS